jgi:hypothetical protein
VAILLVVVKLVSALIAGDVAIADELLTDAYALILGQGVSGAPPGEFQYFVFYSPGDVERSARQSTTVEARSH